MEMVAEKRDSGVQLIRILIAINILMYLISLIISRHPWHFSANPMRWLAPDSHSLILLGATGTIPIDRHHHWWTLWSASYLHTSLPHILFNMIALRQVTPLIIDTFGAWRMFIIYSLSGMGGFFVSYLAGIPVTIGASAALCGLVGAALYFGKSRGGPYGQAVYRKVSSWALGIFLSGLLLPGINNWAHGGGMATGALAGKLLGYNERISENPFHRAVGWCCLIITVSTFLLFIAALFLRK